ncbi:MAG: amidase [Halieaceae bacterium]|nr:amidase [Halieaceae bacterium]
MADILYRSAFDLAKDIKAQVLSAEQVFNFYLERIQRFNPALNAVVAMDVDAARARAQAADLAAERDEDWGPLHGVPITIKDALATQGLVTVGGIPARAGQVPETDAVSVARYRAAGAVIIGKTNVPFMSADLQSYNDVYGVTNNPWNVERTCGGSSGGAAAALAAGLSALEVGSDIGGSIRTPAHFNGIFGHKPSYGIVSQQGHIPPGQTVITESDLSVVGPLGVCAADLAQALDILLGPGPMDGKAWRVDLPPARFESVQTLRVAVWADDAFCPVDTDIRDAIIAAGYSLEAAGAHVDFEARPNFDLTENHRNYLHLMMSVMGAGMPQSVFDMAQKIAASADPNDHSDSLEQMRGIAMSHRDWAKASEQRLKNRAEWERFFEQYDVILCPCAPATAFAHDHTPDMSARKIEINGEQRPYTDMMRWAGVTLNAGLPASVAPVGISGEGLPIGVQIAGAYLEDKTTLAVAALLEQHHQGFVAPPGYAD